MSLPSIERIYFTEDCVRELKNGNPSFKFPDRPVSMVRFLYELCWSMVHGELPFQKCKPALEAVGYLDEAAPDHELGSNLADIVTQMALDMTMSGETRARLIKLARWLVESTLVPLKLFQERCEEEFLWESEMIKIKAQDLKSKEVRVNTRLLYQQTKFNLLREESEGYAKLITLLCQDTEASFAKSSTSTIGIIKSLIGHFDLDPNRVFDIVLDSFELQPHNNLFLDLIPIFPKFHASQVLGFKFQYYQSLDVDAPVPYGLYKLAALLIKEDFIDLDSMSETGTRDHLLLRCPLTREIRDLILLDVKVNCGDVDGWMEWCVWLRKVTKGKTILARRRRLVQAALIYEVWRERNLRLYQMRRRCPVEVAWHIRKMMLNAIPDVISG